MQPLSRVEHGFQVVLDMEEYLGVPTTILSLSIELWIKVSMSNKYQISPYFLIKSLIRFTEKVYGSSPYIPRTLKNENKINCKNCIIGISPFEFVAWNRISYFEVKCLKKIKIVVGKVIIAKIIGIVSLYIGKKLCY